MKRKGAVEVDLRRFLSHCSILFGFLATFFLSRVLWASADNMLASSFYRSMSGWPSVETTWEWPRRKPIPLQALH